MLPSVIVGDIAGILNGVIASRPGVVEKKTSWASVVVGWRGYNEDLIG
jgi:hypothetical protein